jgi:hypothetical protein
MTLPTKAAAVAHVSDAHWEAALDAADKNWKGYASDHNCRVIIDHARCLILLGEVPEPVDPIEAAIDKVWNDLNDFNEDFHAHCRKHFAGLNFPVQS